MFVKKHSDICTLCQKKSIWVPVFLYPHFRLSVRPTCRKYVACLALPLPKQSRSTPKSDWLYSLRPKMEKLYRVSKNKTGNWLSSDHELLIAKFRLKLKKVGKTTRPFRYELNQIPYDYTVEVRNRFKGLDLIDRVPDELWMEVRDIVQETGIKTIPMEKKCEKAKWLSEEALQNGFLRRPLLRRNVKWKEEKQKAKEKRKDIPIWMQSSKE